jgi:hypothetical protein
MLRMSRSVVDSFKRKSKTTGKKPVRINMLWGMALNTSLLWKPVQCTYLSHAAKFDKLFWMESWPQRGVTWKFNKAILILKGSGDGILQLVLLDCWTYLSSSIPKRTQLFFRKLDHTHCFEDFLTRSLIVASILSWILKGVTAVLVRSNLGHSNR